MDQRYATNPQQLTTFDTADLRAQYLVENLFVPGEITACYTHHDRVVLGGAAPAGEPLPLPTFDELRAEFFLANRELGIVNVGGTGTVTAGGETYTLPNGACLYVGRGTRDVVFANAADDQDTPARSSTCSAHRRTPPTRRSWCSRGRATLSSWVTS